MRLVPKEAGAQALGCSRGGLTSKSHLIADRRCRPARGSLTSGRVNDVTQALPVLARVDLGALIRDKAYDSDAVIAHIQAIGARAVIPLRCTRLHQRRYCRKAYRRRNLIDGCFCRLKQFRSIVLGYEKPAERFVSFVSLISLVSLAAAFCWVS